VITKRSIPRILSALLNVMIIVSVFTFSFIGVTPAYAATFTVTTSSNNGTGSLRQALIDAPSGSTITFNASLSGTTIYLAAPLNIVKKVKIDGSMLASKITISGDANGNDVGDVAIFTNAAGTLGDSVKLDSLIITLGWAYNPLTHGGGINNSGSLIVNNCTFDGNAAYGSGGAIFNSGTLTVTNSTFSNNFARTGGGGIYNDGSLTVTSSTFSNNDTNYDTGGGASAGGGIYNSGILSVTNSTLSGNSATNYGGGIYSSDTLIVRNSTLSMNHTNAVGGGIFIKGGGTARVSNSTISSNTSDTSAGGIYNAGNLVMINSTLSGNLANLDGGAMFNNSLGVANIYNSTIAFNAADADADINGGQAGGVYNADGAVVNLINSLVAGNSVSGAPVYDDCRGTLNSNGGNLIGAESVSPSGASCTINIVGGTWLNLNDLNLLDPLQNNGGPTATIALLPGNNAIDHGNSVYGCVDDNYVSLVTDQRGSARVVGTWCDIGAYEYLDNTAPIVKSITRVNRGRTNLASVKFTVTFSEAVTGVNWSDFTLTLTDVKSAKVMDISGSGATRTVTVSTGTGNGKLRLNVKDNDTIHDAAGNKLGGTGMGNGNFTAGQTYIIDKTAPKVVSSLLVNSNPTHLASVSFTVKFSEIVAGVDAADFNLTLTGVKGAKVTAVSGSGATRTVTVSTGTGKGPLRLNVVDNDTIHDQAGNKLGGTGLHNGNYTAGQIYTITRVALAVVSSVLVDPSASSLSSTSFTVTFSKAVTGVDAADFSLISTGITDASITGVTGSGRSYIVTVNTGSRSGDLRLDIIDTPSIQDMTGNFLTGPYTSGEFYSVADKVAAQIDSTPPGLSNSTSATFTFSSPDGTATFECSLDGSTYATCASPMDYADLAEGSHSFEVRTVDPSTNVNATPTSFTWTIDKTAPTVSSSLPVSKDPTSADSVEFTVTFSEAVTGVDAEDFSLITTDIAGATIMAVSGSGTTYTVTVNTGTGNGILRLYVMDNDTILDKTGNQLGSTGLDNGNYTAIEGYTIRKP
jgi:predicted outer membrane repeat protein